MIKRTTLFSLILLFSTLLPARIISHNEELVSGSTVELTDSGRDTVTRFEADFNLAILPAYWKSSESYMLSSADNMLVIDIDKGYNEHDHKLVVEFPDLINITDSAYLSLDIKVSASVMVYIFLYDEAGHEVQTMHRVKAAGVMTPLFLDVGGSGEFDYTSVNTLLIIEANAPPAMDSLPDLDVDLSDTLVPVRLEGIRDNNITLDQHLTLEVRRVETGNLKLTVSEGDIIA